MDFANLTEFDTEALTSLMVLYGGKIVLAIVIFIVGRMAAKWGVSIVSKLMIKANVDPTLKGFACNILFALSMALVVIAALSQVGVETTSLAAVIAAAGLAIGLALQGSLSNFAAGVLIILFRPFKAGDYIEAAGTGGTVQSITIFTTTLTTPDNREVVVPNSNITSDVIINYSAKETRRIDLIIGVSYDDNIQKVKETLEEVVNADERVLKDPEPVIAVLELADSSVNFVVRPWVNTPDYWNTRFDLMAAIKMKFDEVGIEIPFPQQVMHMRNEEAENDNKKSDKSKKVA